MGAEKPYLSLCALYKDHADYLREWIEFHRLVGVERFFLYDNESSDDHEAVLAPYVERGIVEVHEWPTPASAAGRAHRLRAVLRRRGQQARLRPVRARRQASGPGDRELHDEAELRIAEERLG